MTYQFKDSKYEAMGVINITPNSFSDGGKTFDLESVKNQIQAFRPYTQTFDIGAESTAPMNEAISWQEEWKRLDSSFIPLLEENTFLESDTFSFDTYHEETFQKLYELIRSRYNKCKVFWNDVSGKDSALLNELFKDPNFYLVYSHNLAPVRGKTIEHMNYVKDKLSVNHLVDYFAAFMKLYPGKNIILDPCFGFSKTREQNHFLLKDFHRLINSFSEKQKWLVGISRKSFLRNPAGSSIKDTEVQRQTDLSQFAILFNILKQASKQHFWIRTHYPKDVQVLDFTMLSMI